MSRVGVGLELGTVEDASLKLEGDRRRALISVCALLEARSVNVV